MMALRKFKVLVAAFALIVLFAGAFSIVSTDSATARPKCCIWVMYCSELPPYNCWCVCEPVPCP